MNNLYRLQSIFRDIFDNPFLCLSEKISMANFSEWDSVATVRIVLATEFEFAMRFTTEEVAHIQSVADILQAIDLRTPRKEYYREVGHIS